MSDNDNQTEPSSYGEASRELADINRQLERGVDDVDVLIAAAERATFLLAWCKERVAGAEARINQLRGEQVSQAAA